ncbi:MAG: IclR family transcriptional regulator [Pseudomonadota bacterium]
MEVKDAGRTTGGRKRNREDVAAMIDNAHPTHNPAQSNAADRQDPDNIKGGSVYSASSTANSTGTLGKAISVLDIIASTDQPLRFKDLLAVSTQPRGTLHRQLTNLIDEGLLEVAPDHSYRLGIRLLRFAVQAWDGNDLRNVAAPHIEQLHQATGETVHLGILQDIEVVYLDKVDARQSVRMHSQIGKASPSYCTGVGKAALSALPAAEASERIARMSFHPHTASTFVTAESLEREVDDIRRSGISFDREEHEPGIHCVAAAVSAHDGNTVGGISVTAPSYRVPMGRLAGWSDLVSKTAQAITKDLSLRMGPRRS